MASRYILPPSLHSRASRDVTSSWLMAWQCGRRTAGVAVREEDGLADGLAARDEGLLKRHHGLADGRGRGSWAEDGLAVGVVNVRNCERTSVV